MSEERNPFAVGVPILLALAVIGLIVKLMFPDTRRPPRLSRSQPPLPKLLGIAPVTGTMASLPAEATPVLVDPVACTASDAAVAWFEWADPLLNPYLLTDDQNRSYTFEVRRQAKTLAIIIEKGYEAVPNELRLSVKSQNGRNIPEGTFFRISTKGFPPPKQLIAASAKRETESAGSLVETHRPYSIPVAVHLSVKPRRPSTVLAKVTPVRGTYVEALAGYDGFLRLQNGRLEGDISIPNPRYTKEIEVEITEFAGSKQTVQIEFKNAKLDAVPGHGMVYAKPEEHPGPGGSKWSLVTAYTQGKEKTKTGAPRGWMYVDVNVKVDPTPEEVKLKTRPIVDCVVLAPSASELGLAEFNCKLEDSTKNRQRDAGFWTEGSTIIPGATTSAIHSPGSLLLEVSVRHLSLTSQRRVVIPVDTKLVREAQPATNGYSF